MLHRVIRAALTAGIAVVVMALPASATSPSPKPTPPAPTPSGAAQSGTTPSRATFGIQTASANNVDPRGYFTYAVTPSSRVTDYVAVVNYSTAPLRVDLYATDARNTDTGGFALLPQAQRPHDIGRWIQLPKNLGRVRVPARSKSIVPFHLAVPADATPGDHVGGLVASLSTFATNKTGQRVRLQQNVGVRLFARVSGPLHPALRVESLHVDHHNRLLGRGYTVLSYVIRNTGNVGLGGSQSVQVEGLLGTTSKAKNLPTVQLLIPGGSVREQVVVKGVWPELLEHAKVTVKPLYIPGSVQPASGPFSASATYWAIPWILLIALAVVVLLVVAAVRWRRARKSARTATKGEPAPTGAVSHQPGIGRHRRGEQPT